MQADRKTLRVLVKSFYDLQHMRIVMGGRLYASFASKLGILATAKRADSETEEEDDQDRKAVLADLKSRYKMLTKGIAETTKRVKAVDFKGDDLISTYAEYVIVHEWLEMEKAEARQLVEIGEMVQEFRVWPWMESVRGLGPTIAGVILSSFDITKAKYPSSMWKYAGLAVEADGRATSMRKEHLVQRERTTKDGKKVMGASPSYDMFLRTKLLGVLGGNFIKQKNPVYEPMYRDYKHRMENHAIYGVQNDKSKDPDALKTSKGRRHLMAIRFMVKRFVVDLYVAWKTAEGLKVEPEYAVAKLGRVHGQPMEVTQSC